MENLGSEKNNLCEKDYKQLTSKEARALRGFCCDQCGSPMIHGLELVIEDFKWVDIVSRSNSKFSPKSTLLCPKCIEKINGGKLQIHDVVVRNKNGKEMALPMNYWYYRKRGFSVFKYILEHVRYFKGKVKIGIKSNMDLWRKAKQESESLIYKYEKY